MNAAIIREQLHDQIDQLPDDIVQEVADFALFVTSRRSITPRYEDWADQQWHDFSLAQFFRDEDEIEYTLKDAREIYKP